jgi:hypothetical protein
MNLLISLLESNGALNAENAAARLGVSTVTITRYAKAAGARVLTLGRGQHTRYALPLYAYGERAQWPLYWLSAAGEAHEFAVASLVKPGALHVYGAQLNVHSEADLGWPLTPLHLRGYLGRAQRAMLGAVAANWDVKPEQWSVAQRVFAAQSDTLDLAGAVLFGEGALTAWHEACARTAQPDNSTSLALHYDTLANEATAGRVAGSSADGEQPKFSARVADSAGAVRDVLVKFSPPRDTPYGERWNDLLRAEAHAAAVLGEAGFDVPRTRIVASGVANPARTYLESARIDRVQACGRRHVLPLSAAHAAFVAGGQQSWPETVRSLVIQKRLPAEALPTTQTLFAFGHLIGNSDMHFGNLGVIAETPLHLARGQFTLAPVYDMLPMRFAPGAHDGSFGYTPFAPQINAALPEAIRAHAIALAHAFWLRCAGDDAASAAWRAFAAQRSATT